jgi:2-dehydro-3-deoxyphosphogluconate aldolase/(4S)-4-hydroxy-2-oxoglutarate aldolase
MQIDLTQIMSAGPVIPVIVIQRQADAVPMARALVRGGVRVLEVTLRTEAALSAISAIAREVPEAIVGAGTVLGGDDVARAMEAGARFLVSPGLTERLAEAARAAGAPLLAGVSTGSDVIRGFELGLTRFKFFPAESSGGVRALKALAGPFADARFCPTGGVTPENAASYLSLPNVACVGGTWLTPAEALAAGDWARVEALARAASRLGEEAARAG